MPVIRRVGWTAVTHLEARPFQRVEKACSETNHNHECLFIGDDVRVYQCLTDLLVWTIPESLRRFTITYSFETMGPVFEWR